MAAGGRRRLWAVLAACGLLALWLLARSGGEEADEAWVGSDGWRYLTIVDAGSSGCRAHVFRWRKPPRGGVEVDPHHNNLKVKPGLSTFAENPSGAGASLKPLLDFVLSEIPEDQWARSPVYLKATAGLRMVDKKPREAILESVRDALAASPLKFDDRKAGALVIAGTDEGGYGWMSVNYLMGNLQGDVKPSDFVGVVEMGGASAQVTQIKGSGDTVPRGYGFSFAIGGKTYDLYTHSYLGYGLEQARARVSGHLEAKAGGGEVRDPCLNAGFAKAKADARQDVYDGPAGDVRGLGDAEGCRRAAEKVLFPPPPPCKYGSCALGGEYQPPSLPTGKLLVFENFYYTARLLGLGIPDLAPRDFSKGAREACGMEWAALQASDMPRDGSPKDELNKLCFSATYLDLFLTRGVGVDGKTAVKVMQQVGEFGIDWSLGAAIHEASLL